MKRSHAIWTATMLAVMTLCTGWFWSGKAVSVRFDQVHGLKDGDRVLSEGTAIGNVTDVDYQDNGRFLVSLRIDKQFGDRVTEYTSFSIVRDPEEKNRMAVDMILERPGGAVLPGGAVVEGIPRSRALLDRLVSAMNENFLQMSRHWEDVLKELKKLPENDRIKALAKELERLADEAARAGEETRNHIQQEILPKLKEEVDRLKKGLEKQGRQEEVKPLEEEITRIQAI